MKVSLQQLLAFRVATDQVARGRLAGVVNAPGATAATQNLKGRETGPALTLMASSNNFLAEGFFITPGPLASEYQLRGLLPGSIDLREIEIPRQMLSQLVQRLLQGGEEKPQEALARLIAMPVQGDAAARGAIHVAGHVAGHVTLYNSEHDHANVYAVLFKPDEREVEVALYRNPAESAAQGAPRGDQLPALPFFRQRIDITPLLEAAAQRSAPPFTYQGPAARDDGDAVTGDRRSQREWTRRAVGVALLGLAGILVVIWYAGRA